MTSPAGTYGHDAEDSVAKLTGTTETDAPPPPATALAAPSTSTTRLIPTDVVANRFNITPPSSYGHHRRRCKQESGRRDSACS
jgi:hypothetical protein